MTRDSTEKAQRNCLEDKLRKVIGLVAEVWMYPCTKFHELTEDVADIFTYPVTVALLCIFGMPLLVPLVLFGPYFAAFYLLWGEGFSVLEARFFAFFGWAGGWTSLGLAMYLWG